MKYNMLHNVTHICMLQMLTWTLRAIFVRIFCIVDKVCCARLRCGTLN